MLIARDALAAGVYYTHLHTLGFAGTIPAHLWLPAFCIERAEHLHVPHRAFSYSHALSVSISISISLSLARFLFLSLALSRARALSLSLSLSLPPSLPPSPARRGGSRRLARMRGVCVCERARFLSLPPSPACRGGLPPPQPHSLSFSLPRACGGPWQSVHMRVISD